MAVLNLLAEISWFQCGLTVSAYDYCEYYITAPNNNTKSDRESSEKCPATKCHQYKQTHTCVTERIHSEKRQQCGSSVVPTFSSISTLQNFK